jgi:hypothetical protein
MKRAQLRTRSGLTVRRTFESSRLSAACLADAYAVLVPVVRRRVAAGRPSTIAPPSDAVIRVGGGRR